MIIIYNGSWNTCDIDSEILHNGKDLTIVSYSKMTVGMPTAVLLYNKQLKFFPVPDTPYRFKIQGYQTFTALAAASDTPGLQQWGQL